MARNSGLKLLTRKRNLKYVPSSQPRASLRTSIATVVSLPLLFMQYRVPLGSVEEWVIVNQRKGRGEGSEACHSSSPSSSTPPPAPTTKTATTSATGLKEPTGSRGDASGDDTGGDGVVGAAASDGEQRRGRWRRRGLGGQPWGAAEGKSLPSGGAVELMEDEGEGDGARVACERAGPGEVTYDGHPFHLHVNHFQVRAGCVVLSSLCCKSGGMARKGGLNACESSC